MNKPRPFGTHLEPLHVFMDESGDMGQSLHCQEVDGDKRHFSSTRHFTLAAIGVPASMIDYVEDKFNQFYPVSNNKQERKWNKTPNNKKQKFAEWLRDLHDEMNGRLMLSAITVDKITLSSVVRNDINLLFLAMAKKLVPPLGDGYSEMVLNHDERSVKPSSKNSLHEQIQGTMWFDRGQATVLQTFEKDSRESLIVQMADMMGGLVRQAYEKNDVALWNIIQPCIQHSMMTGDPSRQPGIVQPLLLTRQKEDSNKVLPFTLSR